MPSLLLTGFATLVLIGTPITLSAQTKAELVSTKMIWDKAPYNMPADLMRLKDRWFVACLEGSEAYGRDSAIRIISSKDTEKWEDFALIQSPTPERGLSRPKLSVHDNGKLMLTALGIVPNPQADEPLPKFGGTVKSLAWFSKDGKTWSDTDFIGVENYPFNAVAWRKKEAYVAATGCICGSMQTVRIFGDKDGFGFKTVYEKTFSKFFPEEIALVFTDDVAYGFMSRVEARANNPPLEGYFGTSKAPFTAWTWKEMDVAIRFPNVLRISDKLTLAVVGFAESDKRTALCEVDLTTGKFKELVTLPTGDLLRPTGLWYYDRHAYVTYSDKKEGVYNVSLAKIKITQKD